MFMGSQGKNTEVVCHSLLQWITFCQTSPPWPGHLGWPHTAWLGFIELDKAVVHVIRLTRVLWWFQCVCPLMPSCNTYRLTWVSLTLDMGYLFMAAQAKCSHCSLWFQTDWNRNHRQLAHLITRTTALSNSIKLSHAMWGHPRREGHGGEVWRMWSTGEGNGKPLQYASLENPMNSMKRKIIGYRKRNSPGQ